MSNKLKRKSGMVTPYIQDVTMKYSDIIDNALEPQPYYDDWLDWRDGMRNDDLIAIKLRDRLKDLHIPREERRGKVDNLVKKKGYFWRTFTDY